MISVALSVKAAVAVAWGVIVPDAVAFTLGAVAVSTKRLYLMLLYALYTVVL